MFSAFASEFGRTQHRLDGQDIGHFARKAHFDSRVRKRFDQHEDVSRPTTAQTCHGIELVLFNIDGAAYRFKNTVGDFHIRFADMLAGSDGCHPFLNQRRSIGHGAHNTELLIFVSTQSIIYDGNGNSRSNGYNQLVTIHQRTYVNQNLLQNLRFDRENEDVAFLHQFTVVGANLDFVLRVQGISFRSCRFRNKNVFSFNERGGKQALDHGFCHVAAANESKFFVFQHNDDLLE